MRIQTITIDFWGTLLLDNASADNRYKGRRMGEFVDILARAGLAVPRHALDAAYDASAGYLGRIWGEYRDVPVEGHVSAILAAAEPDLARRVSRTVMEELVEAYARPALLVPPSVDPAARTAVDTLVRRGYALVLISNTMRTPGFALRRLLERYGLLPYFKETIFSDEVGIRKPAPEIFSLALRAVGGEVATAVHVGDDAVLDIEGARMAGMRVIHVRSTAGRSRAGSVADAVIPNLEHLPAAVERLDVG